MIRYQETGIGNQRKTLTPDPRFLIPNKTEDDTNDFKYRFQDRLND